MSQPELNGRPGAAAPRWRATAAAVDAYARTFSRPAVLHGGFELYRTLDQDVEGNIAAPPITTPTLLMTATGLLDSTRVTLAPRVENIVRAIEVPRSGHWLAEENSEFVITDAFLDP
jgi:pimeloyl-ACP methyl ester carboxylesterase